LKNNYRPDIDGLRAFAVFSVMFFHLDFEFAAGGFIGVDIFFVISGFLITGIIKREVDSTGGFNYTNFYTHRLRRLFPALFVTLLVCTIVAILLLSPLHLEKVGGSVIHALASFSNIYFWVEAGYFDSASDVKPFLHTWSLSVEEQFYLLWPLLFVFILKTKSRIMMILTLGGMTVISIILNYLFQDGQVNTVSKISSYAGKLISDGRSTIFYLLPFRLYEFALGGVLVYASVFPIKNKMANEFILLLGMILVAYSFFMFSEETLFPSYNALIPCVGAVLIIYSGNKSKFIGRLLRNNTIVGIGLISYSLYLVHWPIIVFWKYYTFEQLSLHQSISILIVSMIVATIMYKYVEQPFRFKRDSLILNNSVATSGIIALFLCSIMVAISANIWVNKGWSWRVESNAASSDLMPPNKVIQRKITKLDKKTEWTHASIIGNDKNSRTRVLVLGDSHAGHLRGGALYLSNKYNISFTFFTFTGCPPVFGTYKVYGAPGAIQKESMKQIKCREQTKIWEEYVRVNKFDYVILSSRWNWLFEPRKYYDTKQRRDLLVDKSNPKFSVNESKKSFLHFIDYTIKIIQTSGAQAIIFGQVPHSGKDLEGCDNIPKILISENSINRRCNHVPRMFVLQRSEFSNTTIKNITSKNNALAVIPTDFFCKENTEYCQIYYKGTRLKNDDDHINMYGSVYLAQKWEEHEEFPFKLAAKTNNHITKASSGQLKAVPLVPR
jgi:peptidoglycan/LPS O-acetylase OafA/YrhL